MNVLVLAVFTPALALQTPDTTQRHPSLERYTIDVATLARDGVPRTLTDVLASQVPGLLVTPGSGLNGSGARIRFAGVQSLLADGPPARVFWFTQRKGCPVVSVQRALYKGQCSPSRRAGRRITAGWISITRIKICEPAAATCRRKRWEGASRILSSASTRSSSAI